MAKHLTPSTTDEELPRSTNAKDGASRRPHGQDDGKRRGSLVSNILIVVGVALLLVAGGIYAYNWWNYRQIDEKNDRIAEYTRLSEDDEQPPSVDWAALREMNPDVVGWLQVPGTVVNYPVYQATDNDYYLHRAPDRSESIGGSVFMDFENTAPGMVDAQTIVYGHHMRNGSQFKQIADMENQALFDEVKTVWYVTEENNYKLAPLFLYYTNENDLEVRQFQFESLDAFHAYLNGYLAKAETKRPDAEQLVSTCEHVLTLSTCNYYDGLGRTLLVCIPQSEVPGTPEYQAAQEARAAQEAAAAAAAAEQQQAEGEPEAETETETVEQPVDEG